MLREAVIGEDLKPLHSGGGTEEWQPELRYHVPLANRYARSRLVPTDNAHFLCYRAFAHAVGNRERALRGDAQGEMNDYEGQVRCARRASTYSQAGEAFSSPAGQHRPALLGNATAKPKEYLCDC